MSRSAADKPLAAKLAITTIDGTIAGGKMTFSKLIEGKGKDKTASFLADVTVVKDGRAPVLEGTVVTAAKFGGAGRIRQEEDHPRSHRQEGVRGLELYGPLGLLALGPQLPLVRVGLPVLRR